MPARAKFLKSAATESGHISDVITRAALGFERVGFRLRQGSRITLDLPPDTEGKSRRARDVLGSVLHSAGTSLNEAEVSLDPALRVRVLIAPRCALSTARSLHLLVNRRPVRDRLVLQATLAACDGHISSGRYPGGVIYLDLDPEQVDVNVHPQKLEVRFADAKAIHRTVKQAVSEALGQPAVQVPARFYRLHDDSAPTSAPLNGALREREAAWRFWGRSRAADRYDGAADFGLAAALGRAVSGRIEARPSSSLRLVGKAFGRVLICEWGAQLVLFEELGAWITVLRDKLCALKANGQIPMSSLVPPIEVAFSASTATQLERGYAALATLGFQLEPFGGTSWLVRAVPELWRWSERQERVEHLRQRIGDLVAALAAVNPGAEEHKLGVPEALVLEAGHAAASCCSTEALLEELGRYGAPEKLGWREVEFPARSGDLVSRSPALVLRGSALLSMFLL